MKGFNIGKVEGIVNEVLTENKKSGNIFGKIAKAIGSSKKSSSKKDWNARVSRTSMKRDQIGSSEISLNRSLTNIQKRIKYENEQLLQSMNPKSISEYNPNLNQFTDQTKIAYAKFKVTTIKVEKLKQAKANAAANQAVKAPNSSDKTSEKSLEQIKQKSKDSIRYENETKEKQEHKTERKSPNSSKPILEQKRKVSPNSSSKTDPQRHASQPGSSTTNVPAESEIPTKKSSESRSKTPESQTKPAASPKTTTGQTKAGWL